MPEKAKDLLRLWNQKFYLERWFAFPVIIFAISLNVGATQLGLLPDFTPKHRALILGITVVLFLIVWFICSQIYLRTGGRAKIGVYFRGVAVDPQQVSETRDTLARLHKSQALKQSATLRYVPRHAFSNTGGFLDRYRFALLAHITHTASHPKRDMPAFEMEIALAGGQAPAEAVRGIIDTTIAIQSAPNMPSSTVHDLWRNTARSVHQLLLIVVVLQCILDERLSDAAAILRHLDEQLESQGVIREHRARRLVRLYDASCRLQQTKFSCRAMPGPDELEAYEKIADGVLCYAYEMPAVATAIARIWYLCGRNCDAVGIIDDLLKRNPDAQNDVAVVLDKAFLDFAQANWASAAEWFSRLLKLDGFCRLDWKHDLVWFADHVADHNVIGGEYLRVLYRRIGRLPVDQTCEKEAIKWVSADSSRRPLLQLLNRSERLRGEREAGSKTSRKRRGKPR